MKKGIRLIEKANKEPIDDSEKESKKNRKRSNKEIYWIIGTMIIILGVMYLAQIIAAELRTFNYQGLTFTKEKFEKIPVFHYYYFFNNDGQAYKYNLFLREDPRKNIVLVEENLIFSGERTIYLSINALD